MDKIWYRNPSKSEVIGRCGGDEKTRMTTQNRQKSNAKKQNKKIIFIIVIIVSSICIHLNRFNLFYLSSPVNVYSSFISVTNE